MHWSLGNKQAIAFNSDTIAMLKQRLYQHFSEQCINFKLVNRHREYFKVFITFSREEDENLFLILVADGLEI